MNKPTRLHDRAAYEAAFNDWCEVCGRYVEHPVNSRGERLKGPHHVVTRAAGGPDSAENLIQLCDDCHALAHAAHLSKDDLWQVIALREGRPIEEIREACLEARRRAHTGE
jgi:predicted restriction endonuclease